MANTTSLPTSNVAGNNQTSPGAAVHATPISALPTGGLGQANPNQFFQPVGSTANPSVMPMNSSPTQMPTPTGSSGSLYDTTSHYSSGITDIDKQLIDIYGKGVGGSLNNLLKGMSGVDSQIFQQWLAGQKPVQASERAQLQSTLGAEGISGNSSVSAIANSNLEAQFSAQAAQENSSLMTQQLQDTMEILMGVRGDSAKETASSGWGVFADVMNNITGDIGNLMGGSFKSSGSNISGLGAEAPQGMSNSAPFAGVEASANPGPAPSYLPGDGLSSDQIDSSIFDTSGSDNMLASDNNFYQFGG